MYKFEKHLTFWRYGYKISLSSKHTKMIGIIGYSKISMFGIMKGKGGLYENHFNRINKRMCGSFGGKSMC